MADLNITLSDGRTFTHTLGEGDQIIGRDPACDIWADDPSTSRRHARFYLTPQGYAVQDLGSKNGTLVNSVAISTYFLQDGDVVTLGSVEAVFASRALPDVVSERASTVIVTDHPQTFKTQSYSSSNRKLQLSQQRLQLIYDLSSRLTGLRDRDSLLTDALDICFEMLQFERGAIAVKKKDGRGVDWPVVRHLRGKEGELTISHTTLTRALEQGEYVIITDANQANADPTVSMVQHGIRSAMCVPLMYNEKILGVIYGDRISTAALYTCDDADFLAGIARQVSIGLVNANLLEEQRRVIKLERELALARHIQTGLFPQSLPNRPGLTVAALNEPGNRVSGDYYDVIELQHSDPGVHRDRDLMLLIADVTGEGIAAALLMANLQAAVRVSVDHMSHRFTTGDCPSDYPAELLTRWNRLIVQNTDDSKFVTAQLLLIDPTRRLVKIACAGHPSPYLLGNTDAHPKMVSISPGFPLGVMADATYSTLTMPLGDEPCVLFCYTDGIVEARDLADAMYGHNRLEQALLACTGKSPRHLLAHVKKDVEQFRQSAPQSDDITMLAIALD